MFLRTELSVKSSHFNLCRRVFFDFDSFLTLHFILYLYKMKLIKAYKLFNVHMIFHLSRDRITIQLFTYIEQLKSTYV